MQFKFEKSLGGAAYISSVVLVVVCLSSSTATSQHLEDPNLQSFHGEIHPQTKLHEAWWLKWIFIKNNRSKHREGNIMAFRAIINQDKFLNFKF